ncbi:endolytic transglycosylase MltG [Viridibacillus sp. YIM B01967]|uniref:Endolytic transglycosylase MltG n=1 Tax=Viridibacillus soli TaxID=2798301 RepID=A0ABS1H3J2_9BACL|nr:endolytic transglycosylase MltG [Viridibacillus soli]MBK3493990.1 endolytic transglycosylase MltG [Viridibacillus soli]
MRKSSIRAFGIALFVAGASFTTADFLTQDDNTEAAKANLPKGSVIIKKNELETINVEAAEAKEQLAKIQTDYNALKNNTVTTKTLAKKQVNSYTLVIKKGMGTSEVSETLEKAGMIKDAGDFELYIIKNDKASSLQIGSYDLTVNMTTAQIAKKITRSK